MEFSIEHHEFADHGISHFVRNDKKEARNKKRIKSYPGFLFVFLHLIFVLAYTIVMQQVSNLPAGIPRGGLDQLLILVSKGITILLIAAIVLALFFLVYGGFKWMTSQGEKSGIESAKNTLIYAAVGLIVALFAFFIVNSVGVLLGVNGSLLGK